MREYRLFEISAANCIKNLLFIAPAPDAAKTQALDYGFVVTRVNSREINKELLGENYEDAVKWVNNNLLRRREIVHSAVRFCGYVPFSGNER